MLGECQLDGRLEAVLVTRVEVDILRKATGLAEDALAKSGDLTFARFEILTLLSFTRSGSLPISKIGVRLQVRPTGITSSVDKLEDQNFVRRRAHETDRRTTLVEILPAGRRILKRATASVNDKVLAVPGGSRKESDALFSLLKSLRVAEGDFAESGDPGQRSLGVPSAECRSRFSLHWPT